MYVAVQRTVLNESHLLKERFKLCACISHHQVTKTRIYTRLFSSCGVVMSCTLVERERVCIQHRISAFVRHCIVIRVLLCFASHFHLIILSHVFRSYHHGTFQNMLTHFNKPILRKILIMSASLLCRLIVKQTNRRSASFCMI